MGKIIGIDLGTSFSCVSVMEGGNAVVISNSEGKRTTPSIVGFIKDGERKIGDAAKRQAVTNPEKTISSIKRFMGAKYSEIEKILENYSYEVVNSSGFPKVKIDDKEYTPQEISAIILQKMKKTAEDYLGQDVTEAVITVPAYFSDAQRQATKEAGEIAGLDVKRIINEPTAASLAYGLEKQDKDQTIAVFDLGGGTFDISVLELGDGVFEVKSTNGDTFLGGDNFDDIIVEYLVDSFKKEYSLDLRKDPMALQRIKEASEKAKIELSSSSQTEINLPYIMPVDGIPKHLVKTISRSDFDKMTSVLIDKLKAPCTNAVKDAGIDITKIDEVILVGGSTRIPAVQEFVKTFFGKEPNKNVNPDEAVSLGAAIQAGVLSGDVEDILLLDVTPMSLGIETMGGVFTKLIDANTTIPTGRDQVFSTAIDNQDAVDIHVLTGERTMAKDNKTLGQFKLDGIPPSQRGVPQIEVKFDIDANGILSVTAKDKGTGKEQKITIQGASTLSDEEIQRMKDEALANEDADKVLKEEIEKLNKADSLIFQTEKQIKDFGEKINEEDKSKLDEAVSLLKESHASKKMDEIDTNIENLNSVWNDVSTRLYEQSNQEQGQTNPEQQGPSDGPSDAPNDDNVQDVDFDEVK